MGETRAERILISSPVARSRDDRLILAARNTEGDTLGKQVAFVVRGTRSETYRALAVALIAR